MTSDQPTIAVCGNPNTGKSTVFNALTGLRQKVANFPGVTVDKRTGNCLLDDHSCQLIDVPGTYALAAHSPDEMIAVDVLLGRVQDLAAPDLILTVLDASNLRRNLFLLSQILEIGKPVVVALTMGDLAERKGIAIDPASLQEQLGVPVVPVIASSGKGIPELRTALHTALHSPPAEIKPLIPEIWQQVQTLGDDDSNRPTPFELERAIIDEGFILERLETSGDAALVDRLHQIRESLTEHGPLPAMEARRRYAWADQVVTASSQSVAARSAPLIGYLESVSSHPFWGLLLFFVVMAMVFQAVFSWTAPLMDAIDAGNGWLGERISSVIPPGALASLLVDGVLAGVGAVVIFLPQILILFALIIILEDTGYMARAAFLMDRFMRACGLSGTSFIPMLSSFACAVPGIMATRVIPNHRDRIATILSAPFMTCSARLPVYALLIAAFIPAQNVLGIFNLQGIVLFAMYMLGIFGGIFTAWWMKRTVLKGKTPPFLMELPPYHLPNFKSVLIRMLERARIFLRRAGTVIFTVAVIVWALAYFPQSAEIDQRFDTAAAQVDTGLGQAQLDEALLNLEHQRAAAHLENSALGVIGRTIEPIFRPLGWDWKISAAVVASFPAREVVLAVLGTIYAVGDEVDETDAGLIDRIHNSRRPDGSPVFSLPVALGLMVFYAFCLQCVATVATMRRETNSWRWPLFAWGYMTGFGYLGAFLTYHVARSFSG
jgi:ferrous iron transport protein B